METVRIVDLLLGRPLASREEGHQRVGPFAGLPMLGLDGLASAAYGPEAALTILIPLGAGGLAYAVPIIGVIVAILAVLFFSYRQTIAAYPSGGGSYTVARENLGTVPGLIAAAALLLDYVLVVAVGISAGVGALVSAVPSLHPHILGLSLGILVLIALVNLRGTRESGLAFALPTYLFVLSLCGVVFVGVVKALLAHGHPTPVAVPPSLPRATEAASLWLLLRSFASGCTAMTGVEAVSNGVAAFRDPVVKNAQRTLAAIVGVLAGLLVLFGGITDRLIPLFAVGAFLAFTLSQLGMVIHWRVGGSRTSILVNGSGAVATPLALLVVLAAKFVEDMWVTALLIPCFAVPLLEHVARILDRYPDRTIAVVIPELVEARWWQYILHNQRATGLKAALLLQGGRRVVVINVPWYLGEE